MKRKRMSERQYRASRCARVLGNPTAYQLVSYLRLNKTTSPSDMAKHFGLSLPTISKTLRVLRLAEIVRYQTSGNEKRYWIKDPQILKAMRQLEIFGGKMRKKRF